jgi:hypothetical protein
MSEEAHSAGDGDIPPGLEGIGAAPPTFGQVAEALAATAGEPTDEETLAASARALGARAVVNHEEAGVRAEAVLPTPAQIVEFHVCAGLNACQGHDVSGRALIAGAGECATSQHVCHGVGACRGQGGCGYSGSAYDQAIPAEQSCSHHGSCASPINECRVSTLGSNKGKSVWKLARKLFETRAFNSTVQFQPAPREGTPDNLVPSYVESVPGVRPDFSKSQGGLCRAPHPGGPPDHGMDSEFGGVDSNFCRIPNPKA